MMVRYIQQPDDIDTVTVYKGQVTIPTLGATSLTDITNLTMTTTDGIDVNPPSDEDVDIITIGVTGGPTIAWDESENEFTFNKGINITGSIETSTNSIIGGDLTVDSVQATDNVGTPGTNVTAVEYGDGRAHTTVLTLSSVAITVGDNVSLATGALIYTLPAGAQVLDYSHLSVGLTLAGTPTTDTPEIGLGTVVGSGANATLGDVGTTSENIIQGVAMDDIAGTVKTITSLPTSGSPLIFETGGTKTIHLNFAHGWADVTDTAATASGTVVIKWTSLA